MQISIVVREDKGARNKRRSIPPTVRLIFEKSSTSVAARVEEHLHFREMVARFVVLKEEVFASGRACVSIERGRVAIFVKVEVCDKASHNAFEDILDEVATLAKRYAATYPGGKCSITLDYDPHSPHA